MRPTRCHEQNERTNNPTQGPLIAGAGGAGLAGWRTRRGPDCSCAAHCFGCVMTSVPIKLTRPYAKPVRSLPPWLSTSCAPNHDSKQNALQGGRAYDCSERRSRWLEAGFTPERLKSEAMARTPGASSTERARPLLTENSDDGAEQRGTVLVSENEYSAECVRRSRAGPQLVWLWIGNSTKRELLGWLQPLLPVILRRLQQASPLAEARCARGQAPDRDLRPSRSP